MSGTAFGVCGDANKSTDTGLEDLLGHSERIEPSGLNFNPIFFHLLRWQT
jgi:hypothetical protein